MSNQRTIKVAPDATITLTVEARGDTGCTRFEWWAKMAASQRSTGKPFHRYVEGRVTTDSRHGYAATAYEARAKAEAAAIELRDALLEAYVRIQRAEVRR